MLEPKWGHLLANEAAAIDVVDDDVGAAATVAAVAASDTTTTSLTRIPNHLKPSPHSELFEALPAFRTI